MLEDLDSHGDIARLTDRLLRNADAYGRFPTPVSDLVSAAGLTEATETFLTESSIAAMPAHLRGILRRVSGKVHAALDRREREVHINPTEANTGKRAFKRLHETSHDLFPWQHVEGGHVGFADNSLTLSRKTTILFEREANQGAAELLFQRDRFKEQAAEYTVGCAAVIDLADRFGASRHAAFRRYVETHRTAVAGVVLDPRPEHTRVPSSFRRREAVCSPTWLERFGDPSLWPATLSPQVFSFVNQARGCVGGGPTEGLWSHIDLNNEPASLNVEAMSNTYQTFVLIWPTRQERFKRRRVLRVADSD